MTLESSMSANKSFPTWRLAAMSFEIALRLIALIYLCLVDEEFQAQTSHRCSLGSIPQ